MIVWAVPTAVVRVTQKIDRYIDGMWSEMYTDSPSARSDRRAEKTNTPIWGDKNKTFRSCGCNFTWPKRNPFIRRSSFHLRSSMTDSFRHFVSTDSFYNSPLTDPIVSNHTPWAGWTIHNPKGQTEISCVALMLLLLLLLFFPFSICSRRLSAIRLDNNVW